MESRVAGLPSNSKVAPFGGKERSVLDLVSGLIRPNSNAQIHSALGMEKSNLSASQGNFNLMHGCY
jgi:hypothetical protein